MATRTVSRVPLLVNSALALQLEAGACCHMASAVRQGEALRQGLLRQHRLFSAASVTQLGALGLAQQLTLQQTLGLQSLRHYAAASAQPQPKPPKEQASTRYDSLELTQERIDSITDKIPQRPVGVVEAGSYTLVIIAAFGMLAFVLYQVLSGLVFEPTALTAFNVALERLKADPRITVRIGDSNDIRAWGSNSESRVARQQIPHTIYKDASGLEHVRIQFFIKGPSGTGMVNADMHKDPSGLWQYSYLVVDTYPTSGGAGAGPQRLTLVAPPR